MSDDEREKFDLMSDFAYLLHVTQQLAVAVFPQHKALHAYLQRLEVKWLTRSSELADRAQPDASKSTSGSGAASKSKAQTSAGRGKEQKTKMDMEASNSESSQSEPTK